MADVVTIVTIVVDDGIDVADNAEAWLVIRKTSVQIVLQSLM